MALLLLALAVLSLAALGFLKKDTPSVEKVDFSALGAAALVNVLLAILARFYLKPSEASPAAIGLGVGFLGAAAAYYADRFKCPGLAALAIGCAVSAVLSLMAGPGLDAACLAVCAGAGSTAALAANRSSGLAGVTVSAVALVQILANVKNAPPGYAEIGPIGVGVLTLVALLGLLAKGLREKPLVWAILCGFAGIVALAGIGKFGTPEFSGVGLMIVPVVGLVVNWLQENNPERPQFASTLSTLIWIGLATIAFGVGRGLGIGIAFLVSTGVLVAMEAEGTLLSSGPLLALALHRVFRLEHPAAGGAIDIGQHYALIGFALAALLPLLPGEWFRLHEKLAGARRSVGGLIWLVVLFATPCLIALFLAPKGLLGFVTGLGFCGFFAWGIRERSVSILGLAAAIGAAATLEYETAEGFTDLARNDKIHWFLIASAALAITAGILSLLGGQVKKPAEASV